MATNDQFQASVVAGIETPGSADAAKTFANLLKLVEQLEGAAKLSGKQLVAAFEAGKKPEELSAKIRILQRELKFLGTVQNGSELFKNSDVSKVNEINRAIGAAARAYDSMRQSAAMSNYALGLDSKTTAEASSALKILERNIKAVDLALANNAGNAELQKKKQLLSDNHALLGIVLSDLKKQNEQEKLNAQIAATNHRADVARYDEVRRLARQRRQEEGSASAQTRVTNAQFDYSQRGRDYASQQSNIRDARVDASLMPGRETMSINRIMAQSTAAYLGQVYKDAGLAQTTIAASLRDGAKVRSLVAEIRDIEGKLVQERQKGNINLQEEARLLDVVRQKMLAITNARRDQNLNDPETRQAKQDTQSRNMLNRASGEGGAALLAVQASLMANYSILNNTVGAMKAAVTTSVELEAAFRNVQAVTATSKTEMGGLESKIMDVAASSKFTSLEVANAALILGQAGLSARQVGEALGPVVMLANAAGTSIAQAVDLVTSVIGVFDKGTSNIADIANKITQAANSSKVSVEKLALAFQYVGNTAAQMGVSFEETTAALAAMSNAGIKSGSTMGTGLRQFLTETQKPSKEFLASMQRIGLSMQDIDFKSNGLIGVTKKLREAGFVASDAIKSFDVRGAAAFNALLANPAEFERQYRLLQDTQAATEANEVQMDSLRAQSTRLTTSLGNLASAGFEPLSKLLAFTTGGFATLTQAVAEHNVIVGILGTALAGLAAAGVASYLSSMAAGALRLAAGAGAASAGVIALQTASKAGSLAALGSAFSAWVVSLTAAPAVLGGAATATWTLTGAITALRNAFLSLSIVSGIGIAIAAATAGFYAFNYVTGRAAAEIDSLRAVTNTSKGAFEEKDAAVKSLTKKIEEMTYKEASLRGSTENLRTESMALTSQFGAIGYQTDNANSSFDTMIGKLRSLKKEMEEVRKQTLDTTIQNNTRLLAKQTEQLQNKVDSANGGLSSTGTSRDITQILGSKYVTMTAAEREKVTTALAQLKSGKTDNMGDLSGASLILERKLQETRAQGGMASLETKLERAATSLSAIVKSLTEVGQTRSELASQTSNKENTEAYDRFNNSGKFGIGKDRKPLSFEDSLPKVGNLETLAREAAGLQNERDPAKIFEAMKVEQERRADIYKNRLRQITESELSKQISTETAATARQMVKAREEKEKNDLLTMADATVDEAELTYARQKRLLTAQQKNAKLKGDKGRQAELERQLGDLEIGFKNRAQTNVAKATTTAEELRAIRDQNIENIYDRQTRTPRGEILSDNVRVRSLNVQAESAESRANEEKSNIKTAQTLEDVSSLMDQAIASRFESKRLRLAALAQKQKNESETPGFDKVLGGQAQRLEMSALAESEDSKIATFADSFISLIETTMKRLDTVTKRINESKRKIAEDKLDGQDRVFEAQQALRETELELALGRKIKQPKMSNTSGNSNTFRPNSVTIGGPGKDVSRATVSLDGSGLTAGGVSTAIRETLNQRKNRLIVESTKIELEENEKALEAYGDDTTGLIGDLTTKYNEAKKSVADLRAKLKVETDEIVRATLQAQLNIAEKNETEGFRDLRGARSERNALRTENTAIQKKGAENTAALPEEMTFDNLMKKLDDVWAKYQATVGNMDILKTVAGGLEATLGTTTGALANAFSSIATGTKSVKDAFKDMAAGIIKSIIDVIAQMLAMQAVKAGMAALGFGGAMAKGGVVGDGSSPVVPMSIPGMAKGGSVLKRMAGGGNVNGGVAGRDSVPTMLMPGEFVVQKSAVDAVGTDYLHSLNAAASSVVSSSTPRASSGAANEGSVVNVWVVTPDQQPANVGPNDIIAVVSDNIERGGSVKKLIQQVIVNR